MHLRTATLEDGARIQALYKEVTKTGDSGLTRNESEITDEYVGGFLSKSIDHGFVVVAEHPNDTELLIGEVHGYPGLTGASRHVITDFMIAVHPQFQGQKIGRTLFTIFLEEIGRNRPDIGKVELFVRESNTKAFALYQSMGFLIEGRLEMRIKTPQGLFEEDIAMGWQNPNFEFD
jgi:putative acetyltransferase